MVTTRAKNTHNKLDQTVNETEYNMAKETEKNNNNKLNSNTKKLRNKHKQNETEFVCSEKKTHF